MRPPYPSAYRERAQELSSTMNPSQISRELGIPKNTVYRWLNPNYAERMRATSRALKQRYRGTCVDCGASTSYSGKTTRAAVRCAACDREFRTTEEYQLPRRRWSRELILERMLEWAELYGDIPTVTDWNPHQARFVFGDEERAQRYLRRRGYWPDHTVVFRRWGSWNAAVEAAGFVPNAPNGSACRQHGPNPKACDES